MNHLLVGRSFTTRFAGTNQRLAWQARVHALRGNTARLAFSTAPQTPPPVKNTEEENTPAKPPSKFRTLLKQYGPVFVMTYGAVYCVTIGTIYELVALKYIDAQHAVDWLHSMGVDKVKDLSAISPTASNFALAWILTKFTEPVRFAVTVPLTPTVARWLGRAPPKESTKEPPSQA